MEQINRLIIGGGMGGVACGDILNTCPGKFELVEAKPHLGGRMETISLDNGDVINLGGELINDSHSTMRRLATDHGIELSPHYHESFTPLVRFPGYSEAELASALQPLHQKMKIDASLMKSDSSWGESISLMPLLEYVDEINIPTWAKDIVVDYATLMYGLTPNELKASALFILGIGSTEQIQLVKPGDAQFMIKGGSQRLVETIAEKFTNKIKVDAPVTAVEKTAAGNYEVTFSSGRVVTTDEVILALPLTALRSIDLSRAELPDKMQIAIKTAHYGKHSKVIPYSDHPVDLNTPFTFSHSLRAQIWENAVGSNTGTAITLFLANDPAIDTWWDRNQNQFKLEFPDFPAPTRVFIKDWSADPYAQGSYYSGSQNPSHHLVEQLRDGHEGIQFVGEHLGLTSVGYMESAAQSGKSVGRKIIRR